MKCLQRLERFFSILVEEFVSVQFVQLKHVTNVARCSLKWRKFPIFNHRTNSVRQVCGKCFIFI